MEIEVKIRLEKRGFERVVQLLHEYFEFIDTKSQINRFFDSSDKILASTRTVFRIRESETKYSTFTYTSTIKGKGIQIKQLIFKRKRYSIQ